MFRGGRNLATSTVPRLRFQKTDEVSFTGLKAEVTDPNGKNLVKRLLIVGNGSSTFLTSSLIYVTVKK